MFEYFPGNYIWNLGVVATLNSGGAIDEVDRACRPIRELAQQGSDVGTSEFMASWRKVADQVEEQAAEAEKDGHLRTAGQKYLRAAAYLCQAERMLSNSSPERVPTYQHCLELMEKSFALIDPATTRVQVPFEGTTLPAYFTNASTDGAPVPTMIMWNGLDSTKEHMYTSGWPSEMAARGISVLQVDCPGSGEALRLQGLTSRVESEDWAKACVDYLQTRSDVRHDRIGLVGWSLGGLLRSAGGGVREAARPRGRLGRQPQLGRGAEEAARAGRREPGAALLGARALGVGRDRSRHVHSQGGAGQSQRRGGPDHLSVPDRPRQQRPADQRRRTRTSRSSRRSTPRRRSCASSPPTRVRPSTAGWTTCHTSARTSPTGSRTPSPSLTRRPR